MVARNKIKNAKAAHDASASAVDRVYDRVKSMAVTYQIRPGERLNEVEFGRKLAVSRTPLREAFNRLVTEGFLTVSPNKGFFARPLDAKDIFDYYEMRAALEAFSIRLACERAHDDELAELEKFVLESRDEADDQKATKLLQLDETFHERIAELSRNSEILRSLKAVNGKIHFVRWIDMQGRRSVTQGEHLKIVRALKKRKADLVSELMTAHISRRLDQIVEVIKTGFAEIYMRR
jgi:DNA-binding GntR family transcriptional regulator